MIHALIYVVYFINHNNISITTNKTKQIKP